MGKDIDTTSSPWKIDSDFKKEWLKKNKPDTQKVKQFEKFEKSVTQDPFDSNPKVERLKGKELQRFYKWKNPPYRGVYAPNSKNYKILVAEFDRRGNIKSYK